MIIVIIGLGLTVIIGFLKLGGLINPGHSFIWLPLLMAIGLEILLVIAGYIVDFRKKTLPTTEKKIP